MRSPSISYMKTCFLASSREIFALWLIADEIRSAIPQAAFKSNENKKFNLKFLGKYLKVLLVQHQQTKICFLQVLYQLTWDLPKHQLEQQPQFLKLRLKILELNWIRKFLIFTLDIIVKHAIVWTIFFQESISIVASKVFKLNQTVSSKSI